MRIIAGHAKGLSLISPPGRDVRPTKDRVREAIFNLVQQDVINAVVLDLFAGSGALGCEALSRGATSAVFIDCSARAVGVIRQNIKKIDRESQASVLKMDALNYLKHDLRPDVGFDLVFLDPPYKKQILTQTLEMLVLHNAIASGGRVICETSEARSFQFSESFSLIRERKYGNTWISVLEFQKEL